MYVLVNYDRNKKNAFRYSDSYVLVSKIYFNIIIETICKKKLQIIFCFRLLGYVDLKHYLFVFFCRNNALSSQLVRFLDS